MLRWQRIGTTSHALHSDHQAVAGEVFRALCDGRFTVREHDVQPYHPQPLQSACHGCGEVWHDMR